MKREKSLKTQEKLMIKVLNLLHENGIRALEKAKKQILSEKVESAKARNALKYYVENWNDTTHPGILALACKAVGGKIEEIEKMQISMLYLTAAVDLLDDVLDGSKVKNGKSTVFGKYGEDITLLLSNAMMIKGFTLLCSYSKDFAPDMFNAVIRSLKSCFFKLGNASLLEVELKGKVDVSPEYYLSILEKKATSIEVYVKIGAIIGGGSPKDINALTIYGKILGMLIILREEFIDVFEPDELKNRLNNEVLPIPILYAFKDPKVKNKILKILKKRKISEKDALRIVEYVFRNKYVEDLRKYLKHLAEKAKKTISNFGEESKRELTLLIEGCLEDL